MHIQKERAVTKYT